MAVSDGSGTIDQAISRVCAANQGRYPLAVELRKPQVVVAALAVTRDKDTGAIVLTVDKGPATIQMYLLPDELRTFADNVRAFLDDAPGAAP